MIYNLKTETKMCSFSVVYMGSTHNETVGKNRGISHLMEHLLCKNLEYMQDDYDENGITFNAYTSENRIVFYMTGLESRITKYRKQFVENIGRFDNITEEDFIKERNIVLSEYNDYFNDYQHYLNFDRKYFNNYGPIGCREELESLTFNDLKDFHTLQFSKPHYVINATQNSPFSIKMDFEMDYVEPNLKYDIDNNYIEEKVSTPSEIQKEIIITSEIIEDYNNIIIAKVYSRMMSYGLQSPLYAKIREEKGLVYYISSYVERVGNSGILKIQSSTSKENIDEFMETLQEVMETTEYLTEDRLRLIKNNLEVKKEMDTLQIHDNLRYFFDKETSLVLHYESVTLEDILEFHRNFISGGKYKQIISFE